MEREGGREGVVGGRGGGKEREGGRKRLPYCYHLTRMLKEWTSLPGTSTEKTHLCTTTKNF